MPKDRKVTRENRKKGQLLDKKNAYGVNDPTPHEADKRYNLDNRLTVQRT